MGTPRADTTAPARASKKKWLAVTVMAKTWEMGKKSPTGTATHRSLVRQNTQMIPIPRSMSQPKWRLGMAA
jgi:hypothetical protein